MRGDSPSGGTHGTSDSARGPLAPSDLARELTGDLPCAGCGYNLRSMSIRGVCPECGTAVRATLLSRIDPFADVLRPISWPVVTAGGLMIWSIFALVAALLIWILRGGDAWAAWTGSPGPRRVPVVMAAVVCVALSGLGALVLVRPHAGIPWRQRASAAIAVLAIVGYALLSWQLHGVFDASHARPYSALLLPERNWLRLALGGLMLVALLGLRPNIRLLASRSLVMRMGRVDRQTIRALVVAVLITALGDAMHLIAAKTQHPDGVLYTVGLALIGLGSMLITVGLGGIVVDSLRLVAVILRPPISMRQVLGGETGRTAKDEA
jgi:hypothetical protein